jgi:hypothetical protein
MRPLKNGNFCLLSKRYNPAIKFYGLIKSQKMYFIPAKAKIPYFKLVATTMDPGFHQSDDFLPYRQI